MEIIVLTYIFMIAPFPNQCETLFALPIGLDTNLKIQKTIRHKHKSL